MIGPAGDTLPLHLRLAFEEARRWHSYDPPPTLGEDAAALVGNLLGRLEEVRHHGPVLVARALGNLAAARFGLTEDELLDVLSADADVRDDFRRRSPRSPRSDTLPAVVWARLRADLEPYLTLRRAGGGTTFSFFHRQVAAAVEARYLDDGGRRAAHGRLAAYFARQDDWRESPADQAARAARQPPTPRPANERKVDELPHHLVEIARRGGPGDELERVLTDLSFLEAKAEAGRAYDLAADLRAAVAALPAGRPTGTLRAVLGPDHYPPGRAGHRFTRPAAPGHRPARDRGARSGSIPGPGGLASSPARPGGGPRPGPRSRRTAPPWRA